LNCFITYDWLPTYE